MTSAAFTYWWRFLVLFGLCFTNTLANAGAQCTGKDGVNFNSPTSACASFNYSSSTFSWVFKSVPTNGGTCIGTLINHADGSISETSQGTTNCTCSQGLTPQNNSPYFQTPINTDGSLFLSGLPLTNQCAENCRGDIDLTATYAWSNNNSIQCLPLTVGSDATSMPCKFAFNQNGNTCFEPQKPICIPPQQLNANNVCETPMCPKGQQRETPLGACKPITCYAPLVKVDDRCELPKCPTGETYEYKNGVGQCVKNDPLCTPPMVNVDGICKLPTCGTGQVLDNTTGTCKPNPINNPNPNPDPNNPTPTPNPNPNPNPNPTPTPTPTPTPNPNVGNTGSGGGNTNSGGDGLCKTPPCGECDPSKETCGNTFGGSCKTGYQCNGDAIQCAVAQATNKAECLLKSLMVDTETETAFKEGAAVFNAGTVALGQNGGLQITNGANIVINRLNPFSSSCPADIPLFSYKGTSYVLPIAQYCNIWQAMGAIMLLIAGLISIKILMKVD